LLIINICQRLGPVRGGGTRRSVALDEALDHFDRLSSRSGKHRAAVTPDWRTTA
jgi:hypothetical protein